MAPTGEAFAAGMSGVVVRWNGSAWTPQFIAGGFDHFSAVWGSGPGNVYAVGGQGMIMHFDGSTWRRMASPASTLLYAVGGSSDSDVFVVGALSSVMHGIR